jgi:hypothetical protein
MEDGRWKVEGGKVEGGMWNVECDGANEKRSNFWICEVGVISVMVQIRWCR